MHSPHLPFTDPHHHHHVLHIESSPYISQYVRPWSAVHAASVVAHCVRAEQRSVLVHCSDGWDRTPQLTALSQLLLDSHFRTLAGFRLLVEKEWFSFGHQFALRCGTLAPIENGSHSPADDQLSPVFLQFIDCIYQLTHQLPTSFEFNSAYLAALLGHLLSCQYGDFLCNTEKQRVELGFDRKTMSAWSTLTRAEFINQNFVPVDELLHPTMDIIPWTSFYCRGSEIPPLEIDFGDEASELSLPALRPDLLNISGSPIAEC